MYNHNHFVAVATALVICVNGPKEHADLGGCTMEKPENELSRHLNIDECGMRCQQSAL